MEGTMEMKIKDHEISRVCSEQDIEKYLAIASQPSGYSKLCCYAVKKLNENEITSSYENICVALWLMFPKAEKFHIIGFDDMPDTDYMEKVIKLRSTANNEGYLTGGNVGYDKKLRKPWQLTRKGQVYANEVEDIFSGTVESPEIIKEDVKPPDNFVNTFNKLWESDLYIQFAKNQVPDFVDDILVCATFDMNYSQRRFKDDFKRKCHQFEKYLNSFEKDTSDKRIGQTRKFLAWLRKEVKLVG